jgi:pantetheine-phosphate adenylyltransferase
MLRALCVSLVEAALKDAFTRHSSHCLHSHQLRDTKPFIKIDRGVMTIAFYPGSFDPMTNGHLDVLIQSLNVADQIVVGIGIHPGKVPMFTFEQRSELIHDSMQGFVANSRERLSVVSFSNLAVDAARQHGASMLIRGLRDGTDLDYEMQMAGMNRQMAQDIQTVFLPAGTASRPITATLVRQIAAMGGNVEAFVPTPVLLALRDKFGQ